MIVSTIVIVVMPAIVIVIAIMVVAIIVIVVFVVFLHQEGNLRSQEDVAPELSNNAGGEIAVKQDPKTGQSKPLTPVFEAIIPVDNTELLLQPGLRGFAKIDAGHATLAEWLYRMAAKTFHFSL